MNNMTDSPIQRERNKSFSKLRLEIYEMQQNYDEIDKDDIYDDADEFYSYEVFCYPNGDIHVWAGNTK